MTRRHLVPPRLPRTAAGLVAMAVAAAGFLGLAGGASAQQQERATVKRRAYFTRPATQVTPPFLLEGFPPATVCLAAGLAGAPQLCSEDVIRVGNTLGLSDGIPVPVTPDGDIVQPVAPGTTPVGIAGGQERWVSLFQLALPTVPSGQQFGTLELVLRQSGFNYALESPAFREAMLAVIEQIDERRPEKISELVQRIVAQRTPLFTQSVTGIEACPLTESWSAGEGQAAGLDGTRVPDADCILGTSGVYDPKQQTWTFDLTFAAQAWTSGGADGEVLPNEGIVLRPVGAPNLAYGDPDMSTNFLISLAHEEADPALRPLVRYTLVPGSTPLADSAPTSPLIDSVASLAEPVPFFPSASTGVALGAPTLSGSTTGVSAPGMLSARFATSRAGAARSSLWLLLLVPLGLGGLYLFGESLLASPASVQRRAGALTRLFEGRA